MLQDKYKEEKDIQSIVSQKEQQPPVIKTSKKWYHFWYLPPDHSPPQIYNKTLYLTMFAFGILGAARGYDEGNVGGSIAQISFKNHFGLDDPTKSASYLKNRQSNITSMVQLGSILGALIASYTVDKFGRVRTLQALCLVWAIGAIIQITSGPIGQLYAGRFIEGIAIGHTTTVGPTYISEVSPARIRGRLNSIFAGAVYFGYTIAMFTNYGCALHVDPTSDKQWIIPTSLKIVFAGFIGILSFFVCIESPRWYLKIDKSDKAIEALSKVRNLPPDHPYIVSEISDVNEQVLAEKEALRGTTMLSKFYELVSVKSIRYRFFAIACTAQVLGQWSGPNAISIYATVLFGFVGAKGVEKLKWSAILGVVKLSSAYIGAFLLIDLIGRRRSLYTGLTIQMLSICYFAIFLRIVPNAASGVALVGSQARAAKGALAALFMSGVGWTIGFNNLQYLLGGEVFPLHLRSFAQSITMVLHFANQFGNSKATTKMMTAMTNYGAMFFFVGVCAISLCWCWFFVPEVAGRSLESMEEIFNLPWYIIGRKGPELCPDYSLTNKISFDVNAKGNTYYDHVNFSGKPDEEFVEDNAKDQSK
jgi:sugar porter (SP) family MFS transporter